MTFINEDAQGLVSEIAELLKEKKALLAVSESCCGGLISSFLVSVPGASQFFVGGATTYSLRSRLSLSGWSEADIASYTGPSEEVATRLARSLKLELGATVTLAETGWAGPGPEHGPRTGTAFFAINGPKGILSKTFHHDSHNRTENMEQFATGALMFLRDYLKN